LTTVRISLTVVGVLRDYTLSTRAVADQLGVSLDTIARWADQGLIPCVRTPGGWRKFRQLDVDQFARSLTGDVAGCSRREVVD
jgi:excisionase family DNA binding protein